MHCPAHLTQVNWGCYEPLIEDYEEIHYRPYPRDPHSAIEWRMEELRLSWQDLEYCIGSKELISDIVERMSHSLAYDKESSARNYESQNAPLGFPIRPTDGGGGEL